MLYVVIYFFFFKQKTAYEVRISDWSSDVCSSDLLHVLGPGAFGCRDQEDQIGGAVGCTEVDLRIESSKPQGRGRDSLGAAVGNCDSAGRSGERRVGKECVSTGRSRW